MSVSIIVPTYKEVESLPLLLDRLDELRKSRQLDLEVLIMDDDSKDGTPEMIASKAIPWVRLVVRTANRGLSPAVVDGLKLATSGATSSSSARGTFPARRPTRAGA